MSNKKCANCGNYYAFYTKEYFQFVKRDCGRCDSSGSVVEKNNVCEKWCSNTKRRILSRRFLDRKLDETISSLSAIKQILEEEKEDKNLDCYPIRKW